MKLTALRLFNVKRFGGRGVAIEGIGDGVNVLTAANEHGKSTCFEALYALFFLAHSGAAGAVQRLKPYSGGNPIVEADIVTAKGRFRLTKQFLSGRRAAVIDLGTGRLVAQADEAEAFIADLVRGGTAGPAGLLWVRQGVTGLEKRKDKEEEAEREARRTVLESIEGEVDVLTGGRRMADILAKAEGELAKLVTATLRPKKEGPYHEAIEEQERLTAEATRLKGEVDALRATLDQRRQARARLAVLEDPTEATARRDDLMAAEAALEAARSHGEALKAAEAEASLAAERRDAARSAFETYATALRRSELLQVKAAEADLTLAEVQRRRADAQADQDGAQTAIASAEAEEREAQDLLARLDAALRARDAAERRVALRQRLAEAEATRAAIEAGEASLSRLELPKGVLEELGKLEIEIVRLKSARDATLPALRVDYEHGASGAVSMDGVALTDGEERSFGGTIRLTIAGVGALTLRSNRPADADRVLGAAETRHQRLLDELGVSTLAGANARALAAREAAEAVTLARQKLTHLAADGLKALQAEFAALDAVSPPELELKADPSEARRSLEAAQQRVTTTRNMGREVQPRIGQANEAMVAAETTRATLLAELASLDLLLGPAADRVERRARLLAERDARQQAFAAAEAIAAPLRARAADLETAEAAVRRTRSVEASTAQEISRLQVTLAELNGQIRTRSEDAVEEAFGETEERLAAATARVTRFATEVKVLDRLRKALAEARTAARDLYLKPVMSELRPLIGLLFDDVAVDFDEDTLLPQTVTRNGQDEDVDRLSGGMREQLSVLTRLAFARLLARSDRAAPVILDDALVYSDDDRIEKMFDALHRQARDQQIIVFSCRQRAFAKLGGNALHMVEWTPAA